MFTTIKTRYKYLLLALIAIAAVAFTAYPVFADHNAGHIIDATLCKEAGSSACTQGDGILGPNGLVSRIISLLTRIVGAISTIVIVVAGIMFTTSAGDPQKAKVAREALIYAVVGILIAGFAEIIVRFVIGRV